MPPVADAQIREVLARIHDPCSVAAGKPMSVFDMGLVLGWTWNGDALTVIFCVTWGGCTMAPHFLGAAERALAALPAVGRVRAVVDTEWIWEAPPALTRTPGHHSLAAARV